MELLHEYMIDRYILDTPYFLHRSFLGHSSFMKGKKNITTLFVF